MAEQALRAPSTVDSRPERPVSVPDRGLLWVYLGLVLLGVVMVTSASISKADSELGQSYYYLLRHGVRAVMAVLFLWIATQIPLRIWRENGLLLMLASIFLLALVLMPGLGRTVNGATRWLNLGLFTLQVSELAKLFLVIYLSGYLVRRADEVSSGLLGFLKPMLVLGVASALLVMEPDFGAMVVLLLTGMALLFIGGVRFDQFLFVLLGTLAVIAVVAISSPYRVARITSFLNPWADPFNSGFQLSQSLIAIGSAGWVGTGLGGSIQKLFYLPEAHTDFLYAIVAEELGLLGAGGLVLAYVFMLWRCFVLARRAQYQGQVFGGFLVYGIALLIGLQAFFNMGVNLGVLPTKGLTLPFMSYGGNSLLSLSFAIGIVFRVQIEAVASAALQAKKTAASQRRKDRAIQRASQSGESDQGSDEDALMRQNEGLTEALDDTREPAWEQQELQALKDEPESSAIETENAGPRA